MRGKTQYAAFTDEKWNDIHQAPNVCDPVCLKNEDGLTKRGKDFINILNRPLFIRPFKTIDKYSMYPISKETKKFNEEKYDR
jgi:hypothetical protein